LQRGVRGDVRNLGDGSVEVRALGDDGQLASLRRKIEQGPPGARVERVESIESADPLPDAGFEIRF